MAKTSQANGKNSLCEYKVREGRTLDLIDQDYSRGEVTLLYNRQGAKRDLLLAVVELIPPSLEAAPELDVCKKFGRTNEVNLRRWHLTAQEAIEWYKAILDGRCSLPALDGRALPDVSTGKMDCEPPWPSLALETNRFWGPLTPLWGSRPGGSRINQMFSLSGQEALEGWTELHRDKMRDWLKDHLPVDLFSRPVLWGSAHLILPNPLFRDIAERVVDSQKSVALTLLAHPGRSLDGLMVSLREIRPAGITSETHHSVPASGKLIITLPHTPHMIGVDVRCPDRGLLFHSEPTAFIGQISFSMNIVSGSREVEVPARSKKRGTERFQTPIVTPTHVTSVGEASPASALRVLLNDRAEQDRLSRSADIGYRWFKGNVELAVAFLRNALITAKTNVTIVDPYFGVTELLRFGLANATRGVVVRILTSKMYLRDGTDDGKARKKEQELQHALKTIRLKDKTVQLHIRVMRGDSSPIHDRFLLIDEEIWLLGSSLNEFGDRGTATVRLPHAPETLRDIEHEWSCAPDLDEFLADPASVSSL